MLRSKGIQENKRPKIVKKGSKIVKNSQLPVFPLVSLSPNSSDRAFLNRTEPPEIDYDFQDRRNEGIGKRGVDTVCRLSDGGTNTRGTVIVSTRVIRPHPFSAYS